MAVTGAAIAGWMAANAGAIAAVSAATTVASTAMSAISAQQQASMQAKTQAEQNKALAVQAAESYDDLTPAEIDAQRNAADAEMQNKAEALQAKGRVNVFAAASGTQGKSIDSMLFNIEAIQGRNTNEILRQREAGLFNIKQQAEQVRQGAIGSMSRQVIDKPSWLETGLAIGKSAVQGFDRYNQMSSSTFSKQEKVGKASVKGGV